MTWQGIRTRSNAMLAWLRPRFTRRRVGMALLALMAAGTVAIVLEAVVRGRLGTPESRVPTALYTRAEPWGGGRGEPVRIGTVSGAADEERIPVRLDDFPDHLVDAVLAVEDQRFTEHHGLDLRRIGGALVANVRAGGIAEGGSTITQQLAKNLFLDARRTPLRKLREAALAVALELRHDKDAILEAYLNEVYLGQDGGRAIHGMAAAARHYFSRDADDLTLAESATLAGMIHAPNRLAPHRHPADARRRRDLVLRLMAEQGRIGDAEARRASRAAVRVRMRRDDPLDARYFRDLVRREAPRGLPSRGAAVYSSLDAGMQRAAERAVTSGLARLRLPEAQAALVALDPRTGEVLAMVGGRDYGASQFNRAADARRQPGSAFKPVVALAALEREGDASPAFTLASVVSDEPLSVRTRNGPWEPANYDGAFRGPVTVRQALEQSLNIPFARIGLEIGPERIVTMARRLGIESDLRAVPSLALGSSEVTLLELARAYGVLAAEGRLAPTTLVLDRGEDEVSTARPAERVVDPAATFLVTSALEGAVIRGTASGLSGTRFRGDLAGKTGTSNDWRDAWFIAYSPTLVVGVWVGFDDGRSLRHTGASAAVPIAARFLDAVPRSAQREDFEPPDGVELAHVSQGGGGWFDACGAREYFLEGTAPAERGCYRFEWPEVEIDLGGDGEWRRALRRQAERFLRELAAEHGVEISIR